MGERDSPDPRRRTPRGDATERHAARPTPAEERVIEHRAGEDETGPSEEHARRRRHGSTVDPEELNPDDFE